VPGNVPSTLVPLQATLVPLQAAPPADQVEDQDDDRNNDQKVNQTATDMETEAQEPQDHKNHEYRPKHTCPSHRVAGARIPENFGAPTSLYLRLTDVSSLQRPVPWRPVPLRGTCVPRAGSRLRRAECGG